MARYKIKLDHTDLDRQKRQTVSSRQNVACGVLLILSVFMSAAMEMVSLYMLSFHKDTPGKTLKTHRLMNVVYF